ncbi:hypothetical protein Prum_067000 [Phytohabitans rumicis]|uniref:CBM2 domain-containing protein n=1 Tax=Phytohabitans rumicis TaxID=1076125 RepID=A0A6V8LDK1_9ACTN|nr:hypothetical protein Prum_067000 [Phytohabitans rumicis]
MKLTARKRRVAFVAAGALVAGGMVGLPVSMAYAATACDVVYTTNDWSTGFTASVTIRNIGDPLTSWNLGFAFPGNQRITQGWSANWTQAAGSNQVTATNMPWNGSIATNGSVNIGFNASYSGTNGKPTAFTINGVACGGTANQAPTVTLTSPAQGATFTAPADVTFSATASDADGTINRVEFYRNGLLVNTDTTAPYSYLNTALPAGSYTVQARAYDNATPALTATAERSFTVTGTGQASIVTPATLSIGEGTSGQLNVKLSAAPTTASVTVNLAKTGDADVTLGATSATITSANWSTGVNVPVSAAQDADSTNDTATITASATNYTSSVTAVTVTDDEGSTPGTYGAEFLELYNKIKAPANGYFSPEGVPYHSVETLIVEAPDHGHETTSEAFSYWLFLEAMYGRTTQNWAPFNNAWNIMERYIIPTETQGGYNPNDPADYAPRPTSPACTRSRAACSTPRSRSARTRSTTS